ncbi:MAG: MlaE family lipid ABC transporter permease subunit [Syntrophaceae bacterium]|nr:MlaE family lipid ABC transporter permease subunit [Syntrophaceae bacterium]
MDEQTGFYRATAQIEVSETTFDELAIAVSGSITFENAAEVSEKFKRIFDENPLKNVSMDLKNLKHVDSSAAAIIIEAHQKCRSNNNLLKLRNVPESINRLLRNINIDRMQSADILGPRLEAGFFQQVGVASINFLNNVVDILTFVGGTVIAAAKDVRRPLSIKWDSFPKILERAGADAVPIVTLLSFLMGCILAFQSAIQLRKFGANIFVADLVSLSICLEMGPLLTALIISGRSGAGYAAHIGTMQVREELDALRTMGIDPIRYLVTPRIVAVAIAAPCLTILADLVGIVGGCLVAFFSLDVTPTGFFNQTHKVLEVSDVMKGLIKSFVFGIQIATIGCLRGFQVRGGAEGVGRATTSAVVTCIFVLTVTNAVFALLFYYFPRVWIF